MKTLGIFRNNPSTVARWQTKRRTERSNHAIAAQFPPRMHSQSIRVPTGNWQNLVMAVRIRSQATL